MDPLKPDIQRQLYIDQSKISHIITKYWWENNVLKGLVEAANTACGNDFDGLVRQGMKVAFSLRAVGPITEKVGNYIKVCDPLTMLCYDWIIHPSHASAYMDEIVSESSIPGNVLFANESSNIFEPIYETEILNYIKVESKKHKDYH